MRALLPLVLLAGAVGCADSPRAPSPAEPTGFDGDVVALGSDDPAVRESAARSLEGGGNPALEACREALERGVREPAGEAAVRRIAARLCRDRLARYWAREEYEIREKGRGIGREIDRATIRETDSAAGGRWELAAVVRTARPGAPGVEVRMTFECADDAVLTPHNGTYHLDRSGRTVTFEFSAPDFVRVDVSGEPAGGPRRDLTIEPHPAPLILAANETRVLEIASLSRVPRFAFRPWSPAGPVARPPVHEARYVRTGETFWGNRTVAVRVYEVTTPAGIDRYEVSDEFGLVRGSIGTVAIEKVPPAE